MPDSIFCAVWLYCRFNLSHRDVEDLPGERSIIVSCKAIYLWRAVDDDGEVVDVSLQARRGGAAAKRFFKRLLRNRGDVSRNIVTDKLRGYPLAHREIIPEAIHVTDQYASNRAEQSFEAR